MPYPSDRERDRPWVMRTYAGHSSAAASNALYRYGSMVGVRDRHQECLIGQSGEIEPVYDEYALSFFLSTPRKRYRSRNAGDTQVNAFNPLWRAFDRRRDRRTATPRRTRRVAITSRVPASRSSARDGRKLLKYCMSRMLSTVLIDRPG